MFIREELEKSTPETAPALLSAHRGRDFLLISDV